MFNRCLSFLKIKSNDVHAISSVVILSFHPIEQCRHTQNRNKKTKVEEEEEEKAKYNTHKAMNVKD